MQLINPKFLKCDLQWRSDGDRNLEIIGACKKFVVPAKLRVSLLGEVGEDVAVDVQAAEEGQEEMQEKTENREQLLQTVDVCNCLCICLCIDVFVR